jgi:hypothetical protein
MARMERFRAFADRVWEDSSFGLWLVLILLFGTVYLFIFIPMPGVAAAAMGLTAALMAGRTGAKGWEKAGWMFVIFSLLVVEVLAIRRDRREQAEQQRKFTQQEEANFHDIGKGLEFAIAQNQDHFKTTVAAGQIHFDQTMTRSDKIIAKVQESIKTITGGDSFAWLIPLSTGGKNHFTVLLAPAGKYPLHDLSIRGFGCTTYPQTPEHGMADVNRGVQNATIGDLPAFIVDTELSLPDDTDAIDCHAMFIAANGYWNQLIQLRLVNGAWKMAYKIIRGKPTSAAGKVLVEHSEDGYPKEPDGSIKWFMTLK